MYATNYFENMMLNLMRSTNISTITPYLAMFLSDPGETGGEGTEVAYTGYARELVTFAAPASNGTNSLSMQNSAQITFEEAASSVGNVTHVGIYDAQTSGHLLLYGQLDSALTIQAGVSPVFRSGAIKWIWTGNLSTTTRTAIMNTFRGGTFSGFAPYVGLGSLASDGTLNEFTGGSYARISVEMDAPEQQSSGAAMIDNAEEVLSNVSTAAWGTMDAVGIYTAQTSGSLFAVLSLGTTYTIPSGTAVGFHAGDLQFSAN